MLFISFRTLEQFKNLEKVKFTFCNIWGAANRTESRNEGSHHSNGAANRKRKGDPRADGLLVQEERKKSAASGPCLWSTMLWQDEAGQKNSQGDLQRGHRGVAWRIHHLL